jgi:hypothetical protein
VHADLFDCVDGDFDRIIFDPPFRWFEPRDLLEGSHTDGQYRTLTRFMAEAPSRLKPGGRIIMNFGTSGDLDYLRELIHQSELVSEETPYGETTKFGYTAEYYVIRLFQPAAVPSNARTSVQRHDPSMRTFESFRERILDLYGEKRYENALSLVQANLASFPDHRATVDYWIACFLALVGRADEAIATLESGLTAGSWWAEPILRGDPDLESVRSMQRFQKLTAESANRWRASAEEDGPPVVIPTDGDVRATLVVLQGGEGPASEVADQWRPACTLGCTIVVPGRGQFINSDRDARNWFDEDETDARVANAVHLSAAAAPLLLAGFSAGGREAIRIAAAALPVAPEGVFLFGPGKPRGRLDLAAAKERGLRVWTFVGEDDWMLNDVLDLDGWIREAGIPLVEDRVPRMGHLVPDDLVERLPTMLDAVLPAGGSA